ncbi:hypothetical protein CROQUDRAFT_97737 [Cronartium quercuum f. sp. fusiforme G11]|uniref:RNase H type-1 domain-containing protein n=1 Tax=Cronartium quercuum f. sp. fusiforme G11 TaxID=708437 RepID=A0A9P6NDI7_9BASI|nr:hypothetical protein CROQUDRAFT_97737 [Cronartium quercuum f. sp. fusiforme G11]
MTPWGKRADAAVTSEEVSRRVAPSPFEGISNYEAEAVLRLLNEPPRQATAQYLATKLRTLATRVKSKVNVELYWVPGHEGIPLNERADAAPGKAAENQENSVRLQVGLSFLKARAKRIEGVPLNRPPSGEESSCMDFSTAIGAKPPPKIPQTHQGERLGGLSSLRGNGINGTLPCLLQEIREGEASALESV